MSSGEQHPKFVMQVKREEPVPKLVSINDYGSTASAISANKKDWQSQAGKNQKSQQKPRKNIASFNDSREQQSFHEANKPSTYFGSKSQVNYNTFTTNGQSILNHNNDHTAPSIFYTTARKQLPVTEARNYRLEVIQLEKLLEIEREQKLELQQIIKQLTVHSEKLKEVNEHIVDRLKDLEKNFVDQKMNQQKQQEERVKKVINFIYRDVEQFIRAEVQTLTQKLKGEKMSPLLEKKLELFMESLLHINQNTVEMFKISKKRYPLVGDPLAPFIADSYSSDKENMTASNVHFNHRLNTLFESKKNESFVSRGSGRWEESSAVRSGRRLINNAYISSNRKNSPSRLLFETRSNEVWQQQNSNIFGNEYREAKQAGRFREKVDVEREEQIPADHIEFINPFSTNVMEGRQRESQGLRDSGIDKRQYFETSKYDENNFHIKQYTPNKRRKIFGAGQSRSKSKSYHLN